MTTTTTRETRARETLARHEAGLPSGARSRLRRSLLRLIDATLKFKPRLSGSEWAGRFGWIPKGTGAESGPVTLYGYQRGLLDAFCDPTIRRIVVPKGARLGFTRAALLATAYHLRQEPSLVALAQPVTADAEDFGAGEVAPMLRETPCLKGLIRPIKLGQRRDKATLFQLTNGASVRIVGAGSDDAFRRYPAKFMLGDEIDAEGWTAKSKTQGDKLDLFWKRGETFWDRKLIVGGTPVDEETSRVWKLWLRSDQRRHFVPCPRCGRTQWLDWGGKDTPRGIKWRLDEKTGRIEEVWYVGSCGCRIDEGKKAWMDERGEWRPTAEAVEPGLVGFHLWTGMSLNPNASWTTLVGEWLAAQGDPAKLQPFVNLVLGRPWKATYGQHLSIDSYLRRPEPYPAEVPSGVVYLTLGGDVQSGLGSDPRIEASVWGWGKGRECWLIGHWVLRGDPDRPEVWRQLDRLLLRRFVGSDGRTRRVQAAAIDSGGHNTAAVYQFCAERSERRVWAIKGRSEQNGQRYQVWPRKPSTGKDGGQVYLVGGNAGRDFVYQSLAITQDGPRRVHFPAEPPDGAEPTDRAWFESLTKDKLVVPKGRSFTVWENGKGNEAGDCFVYAYAATCGLQKLHPAWLKALETDPALSTEAPDPATPPPETTVAPVSSPAKPPAKRARRLPRRF